MSGEIKLMNSSLEGLRREYSPKIVKRIPGKRVKTATRTVSQSTKGSNIGATLRSLLSCPNGMLGEGGGIQTTRAINQKNVRKSMHDRPITI